MCCAVQHLIKTPNFEWDDGKKRGRLLGDISGLTQRGTHQSYPENFQEFHVVSPFLLHVASSIYYSIIQFVILSLVSALLSTKVRLQLNTEGCD